MTERRKARRRSGSANLSLALILSALLLASCSNTLWGELSNSRLSLWTWAGTGSQGYWGDYAPATTASLNTPRDIAFDSSGNLYIADTGNNRIRKVDTSGNITTVAGDGNAGYSGDGGSATSASLNGPYGIALDSSCNLYIADTGNNRIRKVDASTGFITTVAGDGYASYLYDNGSYAYATGTSLNHPQDIVLDSSGVLYIADTGNYRVRKVDTDGRITTIAGNGSTYSYYALYLNRSSATSFPCGSVSSIALDSSDRLYTIANDSTCMCVNLSADTVNGMYSVYGSHILIDESDGILTSGSGGVLLWGSKIATDTSYTFATSGSDGSYLSSGLASSGLLNGPSGMAFSPDGTLYIADTGNNVIRRCGNQ